MKWTLLALISYLMTFSSPLFAALPTLGPEALFFYKSPQSLFSSGQASRTDLEKKILRIETELSYHVEWDRREFDIPGSELLREAQLIKSALISEAVVLRQAPRSDGGYIAGLKAETPVEVIDTGNTWALIELKKTNQRGWVPLYSLRPTTDDQGAAFTLIDSFVREKPNSDSRLVTTIPQGTRLQDFELQSSWIKVSGKYKGFVDLGHVYLRSDFARWAHHKKLGWIQVLHRENDRLRTQDGLLFPLNEFNGFVSHPHRAFVLKPQKGGPQTRSRVEIKNLAADRWAVSQWKEHGEVWWKKESIALGKTVPAEKKRITTEELLKRDIFSMAFTDSTSLRGLVSAKGIFLTEDGKTWEHLEQFGNNNYPVSVHPAGVWYVGAFHSLNQGKTFEPYIRWDKVAEVLSEKNIVLGSMTKILKIEAKTSPFIEILMDTGARRVTLQTHIFHQTWRTVK